MRLWLALPFIVFLVSGSVAVIAAPMDYGCDSSNPNHVCAVPFELIYANPHGLEGRYISLDGVVVVGSKTREIAKNQRLILLFGSSEKARICNKRLAIEIVPSSAEAAKELLFADGAIVSVVGRLSPGERGYWATLTVERPPAFITAPSAGFWCMKDPPPVLEH